MNTQVKHKVAIVTGGAGLLGGAMAMGLAKEGITVGILSRSSERIDKQVAKIKAANGNAFAIVADVLDQPALEKAFDDIMATYGRIDILVNAAGGNKRGATIAPTECVFDMDIEDFNGVMSLNLQGTVLPSLIFGKAMKEKGTGVIINISSMASQRVLTRIAGYSASKAAIDNFTRWLAVEMAQKYTSNIRVNAIAPGFFIAEQNRHLLENEDGSLSSRGQKVIDHTPAGRFGNPEDLVSTLLWLCDDQSSFVTGVVVPVDGGFSIFSGV